MARTVKDAKLGSRQARRELEARGKPYWREIERGLHLGYRRLRGGAGTWWGRHYLGNQAYQVESLGIADDMSDADGNAVLDFSQAQAKLRKQMAERARLAAGESGPFTLAQGMDEYFEYLGNNGKSADDAKYRSDAFIIPKLGKIQAVDLTTDMLRKWHTDLAKSAPRLRTKAGEHQKHREIADDDEARRRRRASANRTLTILKASLNHAFGDGKVPSDKAWRKVKPFKSVDAARIRYLAIAEAKRLVNATDPDFRKLVQAGLQTGARYGELARLAVADFNSENGTVAVRQSKSGKPRHVVMTTEGAEFFRQVCVGRAGSELMFKSRTGNGWGKSHQARPMRDACARAKISPPISFHVLRHTWASLSVMAGVPLLVVARNLGHSDTRMVERHYGHLEPSYIAEQIRARAPRFGMMSKTNVRAIAR